MPKKSLQPENNTKKESDSSEPSTSYEDAFEENKRYYTNQMDNEEHDIEVIKNNFEMYRANNRGRVPMNRDSLRDFFKEYISRNNLKLIEQMTYCNRLYDDCNETSAMPDEYVTYIINAKCSGEKEFMKGDGVVLKFGSGKCVDLLNEILIK